MALIAFSTGDSVVNLGFVERVKAVVFPDLEPENLHFPHANFIQNGLIIAQTHVACLRSNNVNFYDNDDMIISCDTAYFAGPENARIQAVYAYKVGTVCKRYHFTHSSPQAIACHAEAWGQCYEQDECGQNLFGTTFCNAESEDAATEFEARFTCGCHLIFAHTQDDRIYIAPRLPCDYALAVHWNGIKRHYENNDLLPSDDDLVDAISLFMQGQRALRIDRDLQLFKEIMRKPEKYGDWGGSFWQAIANLNHLCREKTRIRKTTNCGDAMSIEYDNSALPGFIPTPPRNCETPLVTLTVSDQDIDEGDEITLTYSSTVPDCDTSVVTVLANGVLLETVINNEDGTIAVSPVVDTTYTIRAVTDCGTVETTVAVNVEPDVAPPADDECELTTLVTAVTNQGGVYNTPSDGLLGFYFTVGDEDLVISHLGRWVIAGNSQTHELTLWNVDVQMAAVTVNTSGAATGAFLYGALATPIVLSANTSYFLRSEENAGGDTLYGGIDLPVIATTDVLEVIGAADSEVIGDPGSTYGPLSMRYCDAGNVGVPQNAGSDSIINLDFVSGAGVSVKTGAAAVGNSGDAWQTYNFKTTAESEGFNLDLNYANEVEVFSGIGRAALSTYHPDILTGMFSGGASTGHSDAMMSGAGVVSSFPASRQLRLVNMPTGTYDIIIYGPGAQMKLRAGVAGETLSAYKTGVASDNFTGAFANNINYVIFTGLVLTDSTINLVIDVAASADGASKISGMQIIKRT